MHGLGHGAGVRRFRIAILGSDNLTHVRIRTCVPDSCARHRRDERIEAVVRLHVPGVPTTHTLGKSM